MALTDLIQKNMSEYGLHLTTYNDNAGGLVIFIINSANNKKAFRSIPIAEEASLTVEEVSSLISEMIKEVM